MRRADFTSAPVRHDVKPGGRVTVEDSLAKFTRDRDSLPNAYKPPGVASGARSKTVAVPKVAASADPMARAATLGLKRAAPHSQPSPIPPTFNASPPPQTRSQPSTAPRDAPPARQSPVRASSPLTRAPLPPSPPTPSSNSYSESNNTSPTPTAPTPPATARAPTLLSSLWARTSAYVSGAPEPEPFPDVATSPPSSNPSNALEKTSSVAQRSPDLQPARAQADADAADRLVQAAKSTPFGVNSKAAVTQDNTHNSRSRSTPLPSRTISTPSSHARPEIKVEPITWHRPPPIHPRDFLLSLKRKPAPNGMRTPFDWLDAADMSPLDPYLFLRAPGRAATRKAKDKATSEPARVSIGQFVSPPLQMGPPPTAMWAPHPQAPPAGLYPLRYPPPMNHPASARLAGVDPRRFTLQDVPPPSQPQPPTAPLAYLYPSPQALALQQQHAAIQEQQRLAMVAQEQQAAAALYYAHPKASYDQQQASYIAQLQSHPILPNAALISPAPAPSPPHFPPIPTSSAGHAFPPTLLQTTPITLAPPTTIPAYTPTGSISAAMVPLPPSPMVQPTSTSARPPLASLGEAALVIASPALQSVPARFMGVAMTPAAAAAAAAALARESATSTPLPQITAVPLGIVPIRSRNHDDPISSPSPTTTHPPIPSNLPSPTIPDSLESAPHAAGSLDDVVLHSHETPSPSLLLNITPPPDTKSAYIVIPPTPVAPTSPAFVIPSLPPEFNNKGSFEHEEGPNYREDEKPLPSLPQPPKLDLDWSLPDLGFGLDFDESTSSPAEASESAKLLGNLGFEDPTKSFLRPTDDGQLPFPSRSTSPSFRLSFDGGKRDGWEEEEPQSAGPNLDEAFDVMTAFAMRFRQEDQPGWIPPPADPSHEERMGRWLEKQGVTPVLAGALASQSHMSDDDDDDANSNDADTGVDSLRLSPTIYRPRTAPPSTLPPPPPLTPTHTPKQPLLKSNLHPHPRTESIETYFDRHGVSDSPPSPTTADVAPASVLSRPRAHSSLDGATASARLPESPQVLRMKALAALSNNAFVGASKAGAPKASEAHSTLVIQPAPEFGSKMSKKISGPEGRERKPSTAAASEKAEEVAGQDAASSNVEGLFHGW